MNSKDASSLALRVSWLKFDVYKGEHVQEGYQSLAYSIRFLNKEATLQEEEIKEAMDRIQTALVALDDVTIR